MATTRFASLASCRSSMAIRGLRHRRPFWITDEAADRLQMRGVREHVHERHPLEPVPEAPEETGVTAERGGVAAHEHDELSAGGGHAAGGLATEPRPGRVRDDHVDRARLPGGDVGMDDRDATPLPRLEV